MTSPMIQVFVSSTWLDLEPERKAVETAIHHLRETKFVGMEYFGSRDETTRRASLDQVDRSDVYVGVIGGRYGSGITEDEYRRARALDLPCFVYFKPEASISPEGRDQDEEKAKRLIEMKAEMRSRHTVPEFINPDNLATLVTADLHGWLFDNYLPAHLEGALRGTVQQGEAQSLIGAIKDLKALNKDLLTRLRGAGFIVEGDVVYGAKIVYQSSPPTYSALHQLPSPPRDFTGRKAELDELLRALERGGVTISGLQGLGGIGKTALALKLAQRLKPRFPDAQFYLDLKGASKKPLTSAEAMAHVIRAYQPTARLPEGEAELSGLYQSVLHNQRALLLMDNAADGKQVEPLIPPESCLMLVTSRQHFNLPGLFTRNLDTLPEKDARDLLLKISPRIGEQADTLAKLCGYLPLALRLSASALVERIDLSVADYLRRLGDAKQRLKLVDASLSLSYELLNPDSQKRWSVLAVFPDTFDAAAAAPLWEIELDPAQDALSELVKYSLLEWNKTTTRYRLHDLARLFARAHLSETDREIGQRRLAEHYLSVFRQANALYVKGGEDLGRGLVLLDLEWPNIETGQAWAEQHSGEDDSAVAMSNAYPIGGGDLLELRQSPGERIRWLEPALLASRRLKDRVAEGSHLLGLGNAYWYLGNTLRALEVYEQSLRIFRETGNHQGEAMGLENSGWAYLALGEKNKAVDFLKQALKIHREVGNGRAAVNALVGLGNAYIDLGDIQQAIESYEQALIIAREVGDRYNEGNALGSLGRTCLQLGQMGRAVEFLKQGIAIARELGDRRGEGIGLFNLSVALDRLGGRDEAIAKGEEALEILEQIENQFAPAMRSQLEAWRGQQK